MKQPKPVTIDFETHAIEKRPSYPPIPVGVSIKYPGKKAHYYSWGHASKNNCSWAEAQKALVAAYGNNDGVLFQNGKFDVDVAEVHMDLPVPDWQKIHDTMFLLFLDDPHQSELGLKPSAARLLNMPPEELDEVAEWLVENQPIPGITISKSKTSEFYFAKYMAYAPGDLVGKYANGDTIRTEKLFDLLWKKTVARKMIVPYDRERKLMPILLEMERQGLPVDLKRLSDDVRSYDGWMNKINSWIIKTLRADPGINLDSGEQLVAAMIKSKKADPVLMPLTKTGKYQTNKDALLIGVTDKVLLGMLKYRSQLKTCLGTFMKPWLDVSRRSNGLIFTTWNQVKGDVGTRTGRLSSTPNFQNLPKEFVAIFRHEESDPSKAKKLPKCPFPDLPSLPRCRSYIVPFDGDTFVDRDYSQQEPRILAHFDGGQLMEMYINNPWTDMHDFARDELEKMGKFYDRKPVKNTNLGLIYGMGVGKLAIKNDMSVEDSSMLKKAILNLYPGLKEMFQDMKMLAKTNQPIHTWGGREYFCEPPKLVNGRIQEYDYKMVNVLIQGSAADCTKEAIIRFDDAKKKQKRPEWKLVLNVHDQLTVSVPKSSKLEAMKTLQVAMESVEFDVQMLSEGSMSDTHWDDLKDYDKKGKVL